MQRVPILLAMIVLGLCAVVLATGGNRPDCGGHGTPYMCPERNVWRCGCPSGRDWCYETNKCKENKPKGCNPLCVQGKFERVCTGGHAPSVVPMDVTGGPSTPRPSMPTPPRPSVPTPPRPVCVEKCVCKRGWSGERCDRKKLEFNIAKEYEGCGEGTECTQRITFKCRCKKSRSRSFRKHSNRRRSHSKGHKQGSSRRTHRSKGHKKGGSRKKHHY